MTFLDQLLRPLRSYPCRALVHLQPARRRRIHFCHYRCAGLCLCQPKENLIQTKEMGKILNLVKESQWISFIQVQICLGGDFLK